MLTPVFHPNIDHLAICTEDIGAAGQTIDQLIVFIGEMICYQAYNVQSPRNGEAAKWAREHAAEFPLENTDLTPAALMKDEPLAEMAARRAQQVEHCDNCGAKGAVAELRRCVGGHMACSECGLSCAKLSHPGVRALRCRHLQRMQPPCLLRLPPCVRPLRPYVLFGAHQPLPGLREIRVPAVRGLLYF